MQTLTYGFLLPEESIDWGNDWFPAMGTNITKLNAHNHDGSNSAPLNSGSIELSTQELTAVGWVDAGNGLYKQLVTMPGAYLFSSRQIGLLETTLGYKLYLQIEKYSSNSFYIYSNDNTLLVTVVYS